MRCTTGALIAALLAPFCLAAAQDTVRVRGTVRDTSGKPIPDVALLLMPGNHHARTDAQGAYGFSLRPAEYFLQIRRLGFNPVNERLKILRDTVMDLVLGTRPRLLDTIVVTDDCSRVQFSGFLCRRAKGQGIFLTEADILAKNPTHIADIFLGMKDFHIDAVPTPFGAQRRVRTTQSRCIVQLFDGREWVGRGATLDASSTMQGSAGREYSAEDVYYPKNLIGVEIYPPGYETPKEYQFRAAGVPNRGGAIGGSGNRPKLRRVEPMKENCVFVNYWTTNSLPKAKKKSGP